MSRSERRRLRPAGVCVRSAEVCVFAQCVWVSAAVRERDVLSDSVCECVFVCGGDVFSGSLSVISHWSTSSMSAVCVRVRAFRVSLCYLSVFI